MHHTPAYLVLVFALFNGSVLSGTDGDTLWEGELAAGEGARRVLELEAGSLVVGRLEAQGVALRVELLDPEGSSLATRTTPADGRGSVFFHLSTETAGEHTLAVKSVDGERGAPFRMHLHHAGAQPEAPEARMDLELLRFGPGTPGAAVGVVRAGELVYARTAGMADLTHGVPFGVETPSNIGSTAKQFLGLALVLLEQSQQLSLDDDVRTHVPELPDLGATVTLRHLLTHTSGYREFLNTLSLSGVRIEEGDWISPKVVLEVVQRQPELQNPPGAEWNYNNTGYGLLALVAERVSGRPYSEFMAESVFGPAGMAGVHLREHPGDVIPKRAVGYLPFEGRYREARDLGASRGAGGVYATLDDMARWMGQLGTWRLGGSGVKEAMTSPYLLTGGESTGYGLGLMIDREGALERWHHGGGDIAHRSWFVYYPEIDAGWMVLSNHGGLGDELARALTRHFFAAELQPAEESAEDSTEDLAERADAASQADPAEAPEAHAETTGPAIEIEAFDAALYAGSYALEVQPNFVLRVFLEEGRLKLQATGQRAVDLDPDGPHAFRIRQVEARVVFRPDGEGSVPELMLHQNGERLARRVEAHTPPADEAWAAFVGRYYSAELETFYRIELEDGELSVRHRRLPPIPLHHAQGDRFASTAFPLTTLDFERDESGRVVGFLAGNIRTRSVRFLRTNED